MFTFSPVDHPEYCLHPVPDLKKKTDQISLKARKEKGENINYCAECDKYYIKKHTHLTNSKKKRTATPTVANKNETTNETNEKPNKKNTKPDETNEKEIVKRKRSSSSSSSSVHSISSSESSGEIDLEPIETDSDFSSSTDQFENAELKPENESVERASRSLRSNVKKPSNSAGRKFLRKGDRVNVEFKSGVFVHTRYPGKIREVTPCGQYLIDFDDGDDEHNSMLWNDNDHYITLENEVLSENHGKKKLKRWEREIQY